MVERDALQDLQHWKQDLHRKRLLLKGVRQVGKTWLLKEFGRRSYENVAYFNFDESPELRGFFESTKQPSRLIRNLAAAAGKHIDPEHTLIIFDAVQDAPNVIGSLKYFCEEAPEYHVAAAGSLHCMIRREFQSKNVINLHE